MIQNLLFIAAAAILVASSFVVHPSHPAEDADSISEADSYGLLTRLGCAQRGREVFFDRKRAKCSGCHSIEDDLGRAGPNLWAVGSKFDKRGLLDAILQPSAEIAPEYHVYILDTETQGLVIGVIAEETEEHLLVRNEAGDEIRLQSNEVFDRRQSELSMMPADIVETISERELSDLLAFLTTLRPDNP